MKKITLTRGQFALIDDIDYEKVNKIKWHARAKLRNFYAYNRVTSMHRFIMNLENGNPLEVDHINHDTLDNTRKNLRVTTRLNNSKSRMKYTPTASKYKGVQFRKSRGKWIAVIRKNNHLYRLGTFSSEVDAALAYNKNAKEMFGEFALLNKI